MAGYLRGQDWPGQTEIYDARLSGTLSKDAQGSLRFGDGVFEMTERIAAAEADVIAISNMFSWQIEQAFDMAKLAKSVCPDATVILGGPHASSFPQETLAMEGVDYVFMGEGEERLHQFLLKHENGEEIEIQGVIGKEADLDLLRPSKKAPIDFIQPLDKLPIPAYDMVDVDRYFHLQATGFSPRAREWGKRSVTLLTSRGCPHQCIFCSIQATMGYAWRYHSPEYLAAHITYFSDNHEIDCIHFEDDNFTHDAKRFDEVLDVLLEREKRIPWDTPNGIRGDTWTLDRVKRTKESGCQYLVVAIESAVQRVVDEVVKKRLDLKKVTDLMRYCRECDLRLNAFYVIGLPGETVEEIEFTVRYAMDRYDQLDVYPTISIAIPLPGTEFFDMTVENHLYEGELKYQANQVVTKEFNPATIKRIYEEGMRRKLWIFVKKTLTSPREFRYNVRLIVQYKSMAKSVLQNGLRGAWSRLRHFMGLERRLAIRSD